jgi:hypothetical protein
MDSLLALGSERTLEAVIALRAACIDLKWSSKRHRQHETLFQWKTPMKIHFHR